MDYSFDSCVLNFSGIKLAALELNIFNNTYPSADTCYNAFMSQYTVADHYPTYFVTIPLALINIGLNKAGSEIILSGDGFPFFDRLHVKTDFDLLSTYTPYSGYIDANLDTAFYRHIYMGNGNPGYTTPYIVNIYSDNGNTLQFFGYGFAPSRVDTGGNFQATITNEDVIYPSYIRNNPNFISASEADIIETSGTFTPHSHDTSINPYDKGGNSEGGIGGTGTFDHTTSNIDFPDIPSISAVSAGMISLYVPSISQIQALASYMWTPSFYDSIIKLWADPMDAIIGLSILPFNVGVGATQDVKVGNISTGVSMPLASTQYQEIDCGSLAIPEYWGAALDYDPYTRIQIYLPYIGIRELNTDDVMNKTVQCKYRIDILSGACCALLKCGTDVLYQFNGQCASNIPLSATNYTGMIQSAISAVGAVALGVASGGASAPISAAMVGGAVNMGAQAANSAINSKPRVQHSGQMGGAGGLLAVQTPYIIVTCPKQSMPKSLNTFEGYPSNINAKLSSLTGYTQIETIRLSGLSCTEDEKNELYSILQKGVIL